ncbi:MAG: ATP-binding protein [Desulfobacterales bacterium]|nr:ATP-binding protein [Desulfobacterales bacterium]
MVYKRFVIHCAIRVGLLVCSIGLLAFLLFRTDFRAAPAFIAMVVVYETVSLIRFVSATNKELGRFLLSIKHADFSQSFANTIQGAGFEELSRAFREVIEEFQRTRMEKETHFRFLQTIVDHVGVALVAFRPDGEIQLINNAARRLLETPRLRTIWQLKIDRPELYDAFTALSPGEKRLVKFRRRDHFLQLAIHGAGFVLRDQHLMLVSMQNIQGELEEKEMEAWQNLIRVLTHEIMNSITPIASLASTANGLLAGIDLSNPSESMNDVIQDVIRAMGAIENRGNGLVNFVENYRELTRIPKPRFAIVPVEDLFERIQSLMRELFERKGVAFHAAIDPDGLRITADQTLIEQVLINLCKNAVEAVDDRGAPEIRLRAEMDDKGNPVIKVTDNGRGIREDNLDKIFIPFFTTRPNGSGVGLSLSRQIMRLHKGALTASSSPGRETVFVLRF